MVDIWPRPDAAHVSLAVRMRHIESNYGNNRLEFTFWTELNFCPLTLTGQLIYQVVSSSKEKFELNQGCEFSFVQFC